MPTVEFIMFAGIPFGNDMLMIELFWGRSAGSDGLFTVSFCTWDHNERIASYWRDRSFLSVARDDLRRVTSDSKAL